MTAFKIIGVILLVFLLLGFLRIGVTAAFDEETAVKLRVGILRLTILPKKEQKKPKERKKKEPKPKAEKKKKKKRTLPKPDFDELLDLLHTALSALRATIRRACSRVRIDPLDVTLVFGGNDPASVAMLYSAASAAMFRFMPKLEETFYIPDPSLHLRMDFGAESTSASGKAGVSLRVCDLFAIVFTLLPPLFKWYRRFKKAHKHDVPAHRGPDALARGTETGNTEEQIA